MAALGWWWKHPLIIHTGLQYEILELPALNTRQNNWWYTMLVPPIKIIWLLCVWFMFIIQGVFPPTWYNIYCNPKKKNPLKTFYFCSFLFYSYKKPYLAISAQAGIHLDYRDELNFIADKHKDFLVLDKCQDIPATSKMCRDATQFSYPFILQVRCAETILLKCCSLWEWHL